MPVRSAASHRPARWDELIDMARRLRPELRGYCSRLMGSASDGEDVVQDTIERALLALHELPPEARLRPWLFRIARNRALDLIRSRAVRRAEPLEAASGLPDRAIVDPLEAAIRRQALEAHLRDMTRLAARQRAVLILKDLLGDSLLEIAARLGLTTDAVKALLARGRAGVRAMDADGPGRARPEVGRYLALLEGGDWDALRVLLAGDFQSPSAAHGEADGRPLTPRSRARREVSPRASGSRGGGRHGRPGPPPSVRRQASDPSSSQAEGRPLVASGAEAPPSGASAATWRAAT